MVDMIYFLHGNMDRSIPSLAEVQLLLYTTVRVEGQHGHGCSSLLLLNSHIALMNEDRVFYPPSRSLKVSPPRSQFDVIKCRALSEFRCVVVPEKKNVLTVELIFSQRLGLTSGTRESQEAPRIPLHPWGHQNEAPDIWTLTFNSEDEALWLISHLTRS